MIRPFGLNDFWLLRRLQHSTLPLAIEHMLSHPHPPLRTALTAPWPWAGAGIATFVLDEQSDRGRLVGFVQLMKRAARPEADLLHLAPAFHSAESVGSATMIWQRLLDHCSLAAGSHGLQRIFASTPNGCPEQTCLKEAGFSFYARETIYRLAETFSGGGAPAAGFRSQLPQDSWALQRLYSRNTPRLVQQAEGGVGGEVGSTQIPWWEPTHWRGIVWEPAGEIRGAAQTHIGRTGHWLRIWGANSLTQRDQRMLIEQGLRLIPATQNRTGSRSLPVYVTLRDYESALSSVLTGLGFAPFTERARFVKHTTSMIRETIPNPLAGLETRQEVPVHSRPATMTAQNTHPPRKVVE